jgi:glucans biosynthesis protein
MQMWRGYFILFLLMALACTTLGAPEAVEVNLDYVANLALARAQQPFHSPRANLPSVLNQTNLNYDKYREIRFRQDKALWSEDQLPFRVNFFHPGYIYDEPVHINEFTPTYTQPIPFNQDFFDYGNLNIKNQIPHGTGYAGFRIQYPLNKTNVLDDLAVFQGASYFRVLGKGQTYGQSARGLALDSGESDRGEEFPLFTDWWLGKPDKDARMVTLYAILDSWSCTGAYEFQIRPGETTVVDVNAVLYFREPSLVLQANMNAPPIKTVGLAPLTSSYWFGKTTERKPDDYRSEVHDSDGLMIKMGDGQCLWEPLNNPTSLRHQIFPASNLHGFGLMQRERDFTAYQDLFTDHQDEPSVWIQPRGTNWTNGDVHLVELNGPTEDWDNIVAFWSPKKVPPPLEPYRFGYTLYWTRETDMKFSPPDKVVATRVGLFKGSDARQIFIDFAGPKLNAIPSTNAPTAVVTCSTNAQIVANQVVWNPFENCWRAVLKMQPNSGNAAPVDLSCTLEHTNRVLSETWVYQWTPP